MSEQILHLLAILCCLGSHSLPATSAGSDSLSTISSSCFNASAAVWTAGQRVRSLQDCLWASRQVPLQSIGLLQLRRRDLSCSLFRYRDVCHLLNLSSLTAGSNQQQQECDSVVDSGYDVLTANAHFAAAWVGDKGPALENLVCGESGPRNPVWSSGVAWTSDGAQMDGVSSRLWVNDSTGFSFSSAFTMVMELKRKPGLHAFIELTDCSTFTTYYGHFWEHLNVNQLYLNPMNSIRMYTIHTVLTSDPQEFMKIAVTHDRAVNRTKFFVNSDVFSGPMLEILSTDSAVGHEGCMKIGYRSSTFGHINGTVRMAAVANSYLSEDVIQRFLSGN